jgi:uncharacterized protein YfcZ (UPF0381/DUF406 family)
MSELTSFNWIVICIAFSIVAGVAVFFLKDVFAKNNRQSDEINDIQKDYATRSELNNTANAIRAESRGVTEKLAQVERDIGFIKQTYATKDDVKDMRAELRNETKALAADVAEIKENYIRKDDFYRVTADIQRNLQKVYDFLIRRERGNDNGKE